MTSTKRNVYCIFSFLQADLVSTIGESAAMGTAGIVIWERSETKTEVHNYTFAYTHKYVSMLIQQLILVIISKFYLESPKIALC